MENNMYVSTLGDGITFRSVRETRFKNACILAQFDINNSSLSVVRRLEEA